MTWLDLRVGDVMAVMCDQDFFESDGYGPEISGLQLERGRGSCGAAGFFRSRLREYVGWLDRQPEMMGVRRLTVEQPFGWAKSTIESVRERKEVIKLVHFQSMHLCPGGRAGQGKPHRFASYYSLRD